LSGAAASAPRAALASCLSGLFSVILEVPAAHSSAFAGYFPPFFCSHRSKSANGRTLSATFCIHLRLHYSDSLLRPPAAAAAIFAALFAGNRRSFRIVLEVPAAHLPTLAAGCCSAFTILGEIAGTAPVLAFGCHRMILSKLQVWLRCPANSPQGGTSVTSLGFIRKAALKPRFVRVLCNPRL
jgi:hypothetical protein